MDPPVVSVVVPTRGRAAYLEVTLDSLLAQRTGIEYEIVVIDDGGGVPQRANVRYVVRAAPAGRMFGMVRRGRPGMPYGFFSSVPFASSTK